MMRFSGFSRLTRHWPLALFALFVFATALPACAQGCALCYTQAAASGRQMIEALRSGILILVIPPTLGSIALAYIVHHKRHQTRRAEPNGPKLDW